MAVSPMHLLTSAQVSTCAIGMTPQALESGRASPSVTKPDPSMLMDPDFADTLCPLKLLSLGRPKILKPKRGLMEIWPVLPRYRFVQRWFQIEHASWPQRPALLQNTPSSPARSPSPGSLALPERAPLTVFATLSEARKAELCGFLSTASCSHASSETVIVPFSTG